MGNGEAAAPAKPDKASSPVQEQPAIHPYPDWAAMQAYYGPGVPMPPPYMTAAVASGHAPHPPHPFMWGPQSFMPPYATPYSAIYAHGVYAHPSVSLGSHSRRPGITPFPNANEAVMMATPLSVELPSKSSGDKGRGLLKKLKGLDGLPVSNGNGSAEHMSGGDMRGMSQSGESGAESSSEESDENNDSQENKIQGRESSEDTLVSGKDEKAVRPNNVVPGGKANESSKMSPVVPSKITRAVGTLPSSRSNPSMDCRGSTNEVKAIVPPIPPPSSVMVPSREGLPFELWIQDERSLKREKRKQSNRESAQRSRLRKQAETEELAIRVQNLGAENTTLRTEIVRLKENSEKLKTENSGLMEKLKDAQFSQAESMVPETVGSQEPSSVSTINLLSKVNNSNSFTSNEKQETGGHENATGKLHQLFSPCSRSDAVAAS